MWYGWLVLYGWFYVTASPALHSSPSVGAVSDVLDTASGFAVWWCFLVLDLPSVNIGSEPHRNRDFRRAVWIVAASGLVCALLGVVDNLFDINHLGVVVGVYNALGMAFLTGRFGSPFHKNASAHTVEPLPVFHVASVLLVLAAIKGGHVDASCVSTSPNAQDRTGVRWI